MCEGLMNNKFMAIIESYSMVVAKKEQKYYSIILMAIVEHR